MNLHSQPSTKNLNDLELMGAYSIGINHELANHVTILSAISDSLNHCVEGNSFPLISAETARHGIDEVCFRINQMIGVHNNIRTQIPLNAEIFSYSELCDTLTEELSKWGWILESEYSHNSRIRVNYSLLKSALKELVAQSGATGKITAARLLGKSSMAALGMPIHLGRYPYINLTLFIDPQSVQTIHNMPLRSAQCSASNEILRILGCLTKNLSPGSTQMTVLIPEEHMD